MSGSANTPDFLVVIPARLGSTRLPRKPLADINGNRLLLSAKAVKPDSAIDMSKLGLATEIKKLTNGHGPSVVITAAPSSQAQELAIVTLIEFRKLMPLL